MTTTITVKEKSVYGNTLLYPACSQAERFAALIGKKTFTHADLTLIRGIGFEVTVIKLSA